MDNKYIEQAKALREEYLKTGNTDGVEAIEKIFPELAESKDEKIRKGLIQQFNALNTIELWHGIKRIDIIAWLEKQGEQKHAEWHREDEQNLNACLGYIRDEFLRRWLTDIIHVKYDKPTNKVEQKFKFGDWVVTSYGKVNQVVSVDKDGDGYTLDDGMYFSGSWCDMYHLWTIQDAKDGDVLAVTMYPEGTWIGILKEHNGCTFSSYCFVNTEGTFKLGTYNHGNGKAIHPATKEQRDLLFQKMHEAGYEWNAEKKELKKIEQKPAEWSVSDFRTWQYIVSDVLTKRDGIGQYLDSGECKNIAKYMQEEWGKKLSIEQKSADLPKGEDYGIDGLYVAMDILNKTLGQVEGYQSDDGILEHKAAMTAVKKLYKQKPVEWSEEDEQMICSIIFFLAGFMGNDDKIGWLNALKDRVVPQKKQEWSKEDIEMIEWLIRCCEKEHEELCNDRYGHQDIVSDLKRDCRKKWDWLENLKNRIDPQKQWKPSEEQIKAVMYAMNKLPDNEISGYKGGVLKELIRQLKAL